MGREKQYAGRYICQKDRGQCEGLFHGKSCPLKERCDAGRGGRGQLERCWPWGKYGKLLIQAEPGWNARHSARLRQLKWAFVPEVMKAYYNAYQQENRDRIRRNRKIWEEQRAEAAREPETEPDRRNEAVGYGTGARHLPLPCGEGCRNCPLPGGPAECPYTDEDEDRLMELEYGEPTK